MELFNFFFQSKNKDFKLSITVLDFMNNWEKNEICFPCSIFPIKKIQKMIEK